MKVILGTRQHINLETYILDDDDVGQRFAQALIDKCRQGVEVNLIRDSVGTLGTPAWRDTDLRLQGPVVAELQKLFLDAWRSHGGPPLTQADYLPAPQSAGNEVVRAIGSSPEEPFSQIYGKLLSAITSTHRSVHLTNAYFVPDPLLREALEADRPKSGTIKALQQRSSRSQSHRLQGSFMPPIGMASTP